MTTDPSGATAGEPGTTPPRATDRPGDASPFAVGLLLRRAHDHAASTLANALRPLGLELRHFAVLIEVQHSGPINQRDLGLAIGMDKAMIVRVVDDLEKWGLAARKPVPGDRRVREVEITEHGLAVFDQAHRNGSRELETLLEPLSGEEFDQLMGLLERFTHPAG